MKYAYISCMEDKERLQQLELQCTELIRRLGEYESKLQITQERLSRIEARLENMVALLGIPTERLDLKNNFWDYPTILRWHLKNRDN